MFLTFYNTLLPINHPPHNQDISDILVLFEIPANKFLSITIQNLIKLWNLSETSISKFLRLVLFYCWVFPRENPFYCQNHGLIVLRLERPKTLFPAVLSAGLSLTNVPSNPARGASVANALMANDRIYHRPPLCHQTWASCSEASYHTKCPYKTRPDYPRKTQTRFE